MNKFFCQQFFIKPFLIRIFVISIIFNILIEVNILKNYSQIYVFSFSTILRYLGLEYIHNETKCYSFSQVTQIKNENCVTSSIHL